MNINDEILKLNWHREPYGLYAPIAYTMAAGGKRVRPQLAMIACGIFGGKEEEVAPAAMALEVFHNFTLLHDDVMDKAEVRRGRPTVHIQWNENTAILSGDQMMIEAYKLLSEVPAEKLPKVLRLFTETYTFAIEDNDNSTVLYVSDIHVTEDSEENENELRDTSYLWNEVLEDAVKAAGFQGNTIDAIVSAGDQASEGLRNEYEGLSSPALIKSIPFSISVQRHRQHINQNTNS